MKKTKLYPIVSMLILIVLGIVLIVHPGETLDLAVRLIGAALLLIGAFTVVGQILKKEDRDYLTLCLGAVEAVAGIIVLASPRFVVSLFPVIVGIIVALYGVSDLVAAIRLRRSGANDVWALVLAGVTVLLGVILIFAPFKTMTVLVRVIGFILVYKGVTGLLIRLKAA